MSRRVLIAGIDFGTSFTKVVVSDNTPGRKAVAVKFSLFQNGLLPSLIGVGSGRFWPPTHRINGETVAYPKMVAADVAAGRTLNGLPIKTPPELQHIAASFGGEKNTLRALLAFYFAFVMTEVEKFIEEHPVWPEFRPHAQGSEDYLIYQLAVPSGLLKAPGVAEKFFREALIIAHALHDDESGSFSGVDFSNWCRRCLQVVERLSDLTREKYEWQCLVYPETAGAAQAYFRSPNAGEGLFITMDVGAGTVDMNAFRRKIMIHDCDYYATMVRPLGAHLVDDPHKVVETVEESNLSERVVEQVKNLLLIAKQYQPNHIAAGRGTWDEATCFIFGGGANNSLYWRAFENGLSAAGLKCAPVMQLPEASNLEFPRETDFGRFAVAAGLSVFRPNLDNVRLPHHLEKFRELYPRMERRSAPYGFNWED